MPEQAKKSLVILIYFALAVSALLVFWQVRNFDFVNYDDDKYVSENPHVLNGLSSDDLSWAFTTGQASNWHPATWLSLMLDRQLFCAASLTGGANPAGFHITNLILHIANILLLFMVLKKMTGALWQSAFVAALFALHPMHVESVAWIAERKDVLSTFFWLLAMLAYVQYVKKPGAARYLLVLLIFALGLMAKPMLVTLPFVLLLLDYWPLERKISRHLLVEKIPFFALSVISSVITFLVQQNTAMADIDAFSLNGRIANVFLSYAQYIGKMFWPQNLAVFYPFSTASFPFWQAASCALLLLGISFFVICLGRNQRYLPVGWFWFVVTLIPVIGIVQVGLQAYADRYTYIPYIGLFIMLAWSLPQLLSKLIYRKIVLGSSMVILLTTFGICAHRQTGYWKNSVTLFSHTIKVTQNNYVAYNNLGNDYARLGRFTEATGAYKQAIKSKPDYIEAYFGLEFIYDQLGNYKEAVEVCKQAVRLSSAHADVETKINPNFARAYLNLGVAYDGLGRFTEAIDAYKQAVKIKPDLAEAYYNLGLAYLAIGDKNSALTELNILKSLNPQFADKLLNQINK